MKKLFLCTMILCASAMFNSCDKDANVVPHVNMPKRSVFPSLYIGKCYCYPMDDGDLWLHKFYPGYYKEDWQKTEPELFDSLKEVTQHEPLGYENLRILCNIVGEGRELGLTNKAYAEYDRLLQKVANKVLLPYEKQEALVKKWHSEGNDDYLGFESFFFSARLAGGITITSNKVLFGQEAGTNLSDHFSVEAPSKCLPLGTLPDFDFLFWYDAEKRPERVNAFFADNTWLQRNYAIRFADIPDEQYDALTLTIQLHVTYDDWAVYYRDNLSKCPQEENVLTFTCEAQFGEVSDFEERYSQYWAENWSMEKW